MGMGLAVDNEARPLVLRDVDVAGVDVRVGLDEVVADDGGEELRGLDGVLFGQDVAGLLLGVGCDDDGVVGFGVSVGGGIVSQTLVRMFEEYGWNIRGLDVALKEDADGHLDDILCAVIVALHLVQADVILAIAGVAELRHFEVKV